MRGVHADDAAGAHGGHERGDEGPQLAPAGLAAAFGDDARQVVGVDDARGHGVLEVVTDVGDAVGPADDLALGRGGRRARPRVVGDAVEGLGAQVERSQRDARAPHGVVESALDVGVEGLLAGVAPGAVAAVVAEGYRLGQVHVEPGRARDAGGDLGDLQGVGEAGAHVVVGEDEHLGLARQAPERARVQDPVAVALEARPVGVGLLVAGAVPRAGGARGSGREVGVEELLALGPRARDVARGSDGRDRRAESRWATMTSSAAPS